LQFRTEINLSKSALSIEHHNRIITFGSCFAYNISAYLSEYRFRVSANPFGVLYNPVSVYNAIEILWKNRRFVRDDLVYHQGEWHSFYHHSDFSHHNADICLKKINDRTGEVSEFIKNADIVILTYGTAFVYKHRQNGMVVSNCHKLPSAEFERNRLSVDACTKELNETADILQKINPNVKIIFTVSPVRHWKDGAEENQRSKAVLLLSVENIIKNRAENCFYFPSYELLLDDLRDYRFYERDLLHPNKQATDYIWKKFNEAYISDSCKSSMNEVEKIIRAKQHRIRNPQSEEAKKFIKSQLIKIQDLRNKYPFLELNNDYEYFENLLKE